MPRTQLKKPIIIVLILIVLAFLFREGILDKKNKIRNKNECYEELKRNVSGVVSDAFFDYDINIKAFVIYFTNGQKYITPFFLKSLEGHIQKGDSIFKIPGTFIFQIYRAKNSEPFLFEDTVHCDKLSSVSD